MKKVTDKHPGEFPVREGTEESSIQHDKQPPRKNSYPQPEMKDEQQKDQPEFIEERPNKKNGQ